ncbi:MAG: hypothetical protein HZA78_10630 [Candidatus Schekmanbacteria bacterium]|nr:hypothetical protein [Candidatus Schekmanbacteria bacterium]
MTPQPLTPPTLIKLLYVASTLAYLVILTIGFCLCLFALRFLPSHRKYSGKEIFVLVKKYARCAVPTVMFLNFLFWLYILGYFSPYRWEAKRRIYNFLEALKKEDYQTALKYYGSKTKNMNYLKNFVSQLTPNKIRDFEIVFIFYDRGISTPPHITVYVKINGQAPPDALYVDFIDNDISFAAENFYIPE